MTRRRPPERYVDVDGERIGQRRWAVLRAVPDYGALVLTHVRALDGWVSVETRWHGVGVLLRAGNRPAVWRTTISGGPLEGRAWPSSTRTAAHRRHDEAVADVVRLITAAALELAVAQ